ncbi:hypothetical protein FPV67DRAFT_1483737 [Lyophyllum atratum]|nr:hypothetical protein FPV67DRAFT_1483737 [Lyophyllum atratum]
MSSAVTTKSKKEKKVKPKSVPDAPIPSTDKAVELDTSASTSSAKKSKKRKMKEDEVAEPKEPVVETKSTKSKKPLKEQPQPIAEEKVEVVESKKKKRKGTKEEASKSTEKSEKPTPTSAPIPAEPIPDSISATRKASNTSKSPKTADKPSKKSKKVKAKEPSPLPEPEPVVPSEEEPVDAESGDDEEDLHLHGFSTDDDSSDEEDAMDHEPSAFDISKLPTIAKDDATVKRKLEKAKRQPTQDLGVLFLGRVPHGFYEDQMRGYFSQFGTVTRVRLSRNKKTGRSKHYGFVEFDSSSVAQIVADTMDNYLLMGHILRCKVIPKDEVHPELWVGANRKWRAVPRDRLTRVEHNKPRTEEEQVRAAKRLIKRQNDRKRKLADAGIKYDFEAVKYKKAKEAEA